MMRKNHYDRYSEHMSDFKSMFETIMKIVKFAQNYANLKSSNAKNVTLSELINASNRALTVIILQQAKNQLSIAKSVVTKTQMNDLMNFFRRLTLTLQMNDLLNRQESASTSTTSMTAASMRSTTEDVISKVHAESEYVSRSESRASDTNRCFYCHEKEYKRISCLILQSQIARDQIHINERERVARDKTDEIEFFIAFEMSSVESVRRILENEKHSFNA